MQIAKLLGNVSWWVFVVARLMGEMGPPTRGAPRDLMDYLRIDGTFRTGGSYTPMTDASFIAPDSTASDVLIVISVIALALTVVVAVVQAVLARRLLAGIATVLAPVAGGALILWAIEHREGVPGTVELPVAWVFVLVLAALAVRGLAVGLDTRVRRAEPQRS